MIPGLEQDSDQAREHANEHSRAASSVTGDGESEQGTGYIGGSFVSDAEGRARHVDGPTAGPVPGDDKGVPGSSVGGPGTSW